MDWTHKIRLRHLEVLLSLARTQNLTRTATELNTHQPGLSKMLRDVETDMGVDLFDRRARGLALNDNGRIALAHVRRIKAALDAFRDEMAVVAQRGSGLLSIGIAGASSIDALPSAVLSLTRQMPDAHIRITEGPPDTLRPRLVDGELDIMVGQSGLAFDPAQDIREEPLFRDRICLCVRWSHPLATREALTWEEVTAYPLVVWAAGTPIRRALDDALAQAGWTLPPTYLESNSASVNVNLLVNSDMVGFSMQRGAESYRAYRMLQILPLDLGSTGAVSMYWRGADGGRRLVELALAGLRRMAAR